MIHCSLDLLLFDLPKMGLTDTSQPSFNAVFLGKPAYIFTTVKKSTLLGQHMRLGTFIR